jgi:hypothetical protein
MSERKIPTLMYEGPGIAPMVGPTGLIWAIRAKEKAMKDNTYLDVDDVTHDFGFTFTNEEEVSSPVYESTAQEVEDLKQRLRAINKIYMPLLENLNRDPGKEFIRWPDRKELLDKQILKLKNLTNV